MLNKMKSAFGGSIKKKIFAAGASIFGGLFLLSGVAFAQPGSAVQPPIAPICVGIGVAFDGTDILYTCAGDPSIHKTDLTGVPNVVVPTTDGVGNPISVDAIAWDPNEGKIWGGALVDTDGVGGNDTCRIYSIDPVTGAATTRFSYVDVHGGCSFVFYDGLTVDSVTDTIWASPDVHGFIHHYTKAGVEIAADLMDFAALTPVGEPDVNSGLAIGIDGTLYAGTNGFAKIVRIDTPGGGATFGGVFATVSGRDEDLECGPVIDGKETILSKQLEGPIDVLEAPKGTCQRPEEPRGEVACIETVNPHGKTVPPAGSTTLPGPKGGQNEDGFYELSIVGGFPIGTTLSVTDAFGSGPFGGFLPGVMVKITEAPGSIPSIKKIGSGTGKAGAIAAHITLKGDPIINALLGAVTIGSTSCLVPPPPK